MQHVPLIRVYACFTGIALTLGAALALGQATSIPFPVPEPNPGALIAQRDSFWLWLAAQSTFFGVLLFILASGFGTKLARACARVCEERRLLAASMVATVLAVVLSLSQAPIDFIEFLRREAWGLSEQSVLSWAGGEISWLLTVAVIAGALGWIPFLLIRKFPRTWWLLASAALVAVGSTYFLIRPVWIDPLSKTYTAVSDAEWQTRIDHLAVRAGITDLPVLIWQTKPTDFCRIQNSVVGLGPTRTVILADQIFAEWDASEIEAGIAHELKHYIFDNTWLPVLILVGLTTGGALTIFVLGNTVIRYGANRLGFDSLSDPAAIPLILLCLQLFLLLAIPTFNLTAQHVELEADRFALELTRNNAARASVSADVCGRLWVSESSLFDRLYRFTHPSIVERIDLANSYKPWEAGEPLAYSGTISDVE